MRPLHHAVRITALLIISYLAVQLYINYMRSASKPTIKKKILKDFHEDPTPCKMHSCFNYKLCPWNSGFGVHVYSPLVHPDNVQNIEYYFLVLDRYIKGSETEEVEKSPCLYVVTVYEGNVHKNPHLIPSSINNTFHIKASILKNLPYWGKDGRNHLIINLSKNVLFMDKSLGKAMVAQPTFTETGFRPGFDIIIPTIWPPKNDEGSFSPKIRPPSRRYLLSFQGSGGYGYDLLDSITQFNASMIDDKILIQLECFVTKKNQASVSIMDWALCGKFSARRFILEKSTFVLILAPSNQYLTTGIFHSRLYEALKSGGIPVILGGDRVRLPFDEVLDWRRAALQIPETRVAELIYLLTTVSDDDLLEFRQQGRKLWEIYFSSLKGSLHSVLAIIRSRLMLPPPPVVLAKARPGFKNKSFTPPTDLISHPVINQDEGEPPTTPVKPVYRRNFTTTLLQGYRLWNDWGEPFVMYPQLPWDPVPVDKQVIRELGSKNLKVVAVSEKFTIVINSFKPQTCLKNILINLRDLPHLDKVVVLWNDRIQPENMAWPQLNVPVQVIRPLHNYQQNPFLPYSLYKTEAVFLLHDDLIIKQSDIVLAFRVWREHRDRIVGFLPRYHVNYEYYTETSNHSSMISTGAAFIHRYYLWAYWRLLPTAITEHVDIVGICDDIAMNFLVSHLTKKPPIQVPFDEANSTSTCSNSTKIPKKRNEKRDYCLKYFSKIMGYMPLIETELIFDLKTSFIHRRNATANVTLTTANATLTTANATLNTANATLNTANATLNNANATLTTANATLTTLNATLNTSNATLTTTHAAHKNSKSFFDKLVKKPIPPAKN